MFQMRMSLGVAACLLLSAPVGAQNAQQRVEWNRPFPPFRIADNVYYVGTTGLGAYLITNPTGHVLIDGGLPESAPHIANSIRALGFELTDIRYLLINHAHFDHSGGLAELKRRTGARLVASAGDRRDLERGSVAGRPEIASAPPVRVDRVIRDRESIAVGEGRLVADITPGHTRGCTSWSYEINGRIFLFACSLTVAGQNLVNDPTYPHAASDFLNTFARLRRTKADVFLNFHPDFFDMEGKRARQQSGEQDAFVDATELGRQLDRAERSFQWEWRAQIQQQRRAKLQT